MNEYLWNGGVTANIRISSCVSKLTCKSVIQVIEALISGETNPDNLVKLVYGNTKNKRSGKLRNALTGNMKEHHRQSLEWAKQEYDLYEKQASECFFAMEKICKEHYSKELELLQTMPGISKISAMSIIAETGADIVWCVLKENKPYNPNLVHICDPVKAARSIDYHQKEIERIRLLYKEVV